MIFIILIILTLSSCHIESINDTIYIASIGLEYEDNQFKGYFLLPDSLNVGDAKEASLSSSVAIAYGNDFNDVFYNLEVSTALRLNLMHISTLILHESIYPFLENLIYYIKDSAMFDYNFYILAAKDIEGVFKCKNPSNEGTMLTPILEPMDSDYLFLKASPIHFLRFAKMILANMTVSIPYLEANTVWDDKKEAIDARKIVLIKDSFIILDDDRFSLFKSNIKNNAIINGKSYLLDDYKYKFDYRQGIITISYIVSKGVKDEIYKGVRGLLNEVDIDFLNLAYYGLSLSRVKIEINEKVMKA